MISAIPSHRKTQALLRYRTATLLGCTAVIALLPAFALAQETNGDATVLETNYHPGKWPVGQ